MLKKEESLAKKEKVLDGRIIGKGREKMETKYLPAL